MTYNIEKIIKNIEKSKDYLIITKLDNVLIVGIKLNLIQVFIKGEMNFMTAPFQQKAKKQLGVFFLIKNIKKTSEIEKTFVKNDLPVLDLTEYAKIYTKDLTEENLKDILNKFIENRFNSYKPDEVVNI
jgi:hypothetical protein